MSNPSPREKAKAKPEAFEVRLERLETIAESLKDSKVPLEQAMAMFEEAVKLARGLEKELAGIEQRVELLVNEPDANGTPELSLFPEFDGD